MKTHLLLSLRVLKRNLRFSALAAVCLAVAIGGNVVLASFMDAILFRPLPFEGGESLVFVMNEFRHGEGEPQPFSLSYFNFAQAAQQSRLLDVLEGIGDRAFNLQGEGGAEKIDGAEVTGGFLSKLGVKMMHGRHFLPEEDLPGGPEVVILSHGFYQRRFGSSSLVVGSSITLDGVGHTIVGVLEPGFEPIVDEADLYVPMKGDPRDNSLAARRFHTMHGIGLMRRGATVGQLEEELGEIASRLEAQYPDTNRNWGLVAIPLRQYLIGDLRTRLFTLQIAAALVLVVACANLANFFFMEAERRAGETAVRVAMGATRTSIAFQFFTQGMVLAVLGGALATVLSIFTIPLLSRLETFSYLGPLVGDVQLDGRLLAFNLLLTVGVGIFFSLLLTLRSFRANLPELLKSERRATGSVRGMRFLRGLVIVEVALALVLMAGSALTFQSLRNLDRADPGFEVEGGAVARISLPEYKYSTAESRVDFVSRIREAVEGLAEVEAAGISTDIPSLDRSGRSASFNVEGRPELSSGGALYARYYLVSPGYLEVLGLGALDGRLLDARDHAQAPGAVVVSKAMAQRYWPERSAVGQRIQRGAMPSGESPMLTVVGVVDDVRDNGVAVPPEPTFYLPYAQHAATSTALEVALLARSERPGQVLDEIRGRVRDMDAEVPVSEQLTLDDHVASAVGDYRFSAWLSSLFSLLSVSLAILGIYGIISYFVVIRRREVGVRIALGAQKRAILRWIFRQGLGLVAAGSAFGLLATLVLTRYLSSQLYGVSPLEPFTLLLVVVLLGTTASIACFLPARRAAGVDPAIVIRDDE